MDKKLEKLSKILSKLDVKSVQQGNIVVNIAALLKMQKVIEEEVGENVKIADTFQILIDTVMGGGVVVLTDESTTGQAISVEFTKKIEF